MKLFFEKYHGAGNDFIVIDNTQGEINPDQKTIARICHRNFGIGADGMIFLEHSVNYDFKMKYFNADGNEGSLCGNGGRCIVYYTFKKNLVGSKTTFEAIDGLHEAIVLKEEGNNGIISLKMGDVHRVEKLGEDFYLNTGSPHLVRIVRDINQFDAREEGIRLRWDERFQPEGVNVNFMKLEGRELFVRTYERGVENLTLACGTGVVASAIVANEIATEKASTYFISTDGGELKVSFRYQNNTYSDIWLEGPVEKVFDGVVEL
jgi:diaminopimelate epimerase